ncbi:unnamed protein product [Rotaria sp. Silwood1]|nr:unnamed protein product [Rotaria sp. Silwood1]
MYEKEENNWKLCDLFSSYENIYQLSELFVVTMEWFWAVYQLNVRDKSECQTSLLSNSGFSSWANQRRENPNEELYRYNENLGQMRKVT